MLLLMLGFSIQHLESSIQNSASLRAVALRAGGQLRAPCSPPDEPAVAGSQRWRRFCSDFWPMITGLERNNFLKLTILFLRVLSVGAAVGYALVSR
jgi:hypothetical protein